MGAPTFEALEISADGSPYKYRLRPLDDVPGKRPDDVRYEVDAVYNRQSGPIFRPFEGPDMRRDAFQMARQLIAEGFVVVSIRQAATGSDWRRTVYERVAPVCPPDHYPPSRPEVARVTVK